MEKSDFEKLTVQERHDYTKVTGLESPLTRNDNSSLMANGFSYASTGNIEKFPKVLRQKLLSETFSSIQQEELHLAELPETPANKATAANAAKRLLLYKRFYEFIKKSFVL